MADIGTIKSGDRVIMRGVAENVRMNAGSEECTVKLSDEGNFEYVTIWTKFVEKERCAIPDCKTTVNVLGTEYTISVVGYDEDEYFQKNYVAGYRNGLLKEIVLCDMHTHPDYKDDTEDNLKALYKDTLRHEIVHAFFWESGIDAGGHKTEESFALDEELVDWIAIQGPKIYKAWESVGAI